MNISVQPPQALSGNPSSPAVSRTLVAVVPTEITNNIADFDDVSDYAKNSVLMLSNLGIVSGKGNNRFAPKAFATRAEASVMIYNLLEALK